MRPSFARITITRLRYPTTTDHGVQVVDYDADPAETPIGGCWLEPTTSAENNTDRSAVLTGYRVSAPWDVDLTAGDRVRYGGLEFEVDGEPLRVPSPTGALNECVFVLKLWRG